jgi:hypothetical protein
MAGVRTQIYLERLDDEWGGYDTPGYLAIAILPNLQYVSFYFAARCAQEGHTASSHSTNASVERNMHIDMVLAASTRTLGSWPRCHSPWIVTRRKPTWFLAT